VFAEQADGIGLCRPGSSCSTHLPALHLICLIIGLVALYLPITSEAETPAHPAQNCSASTLSPVSYATGSQTAAEAVPNQRYEVVARYPHDRHAFTQGLVFYQGELYESTGIRGRSSVRRLDLESGRVLEAKQLDKTLFGEGLTVADHHLVQLTWQSGRAFIYAPDDLRETGTFSFGGEGWGIVVVDGRMVISDGSSWLRFIKPENYQQTGSLQVTYRGQPVVGLNELEQVNGLIYANIYPGDCIAMIDPRSGQVVSWIDLGGLMPLSERQNGSAVANGIAYNPENGDLFVTGKLWPYIYQLKLLETEALPDKQTALPEVMG